MKGFAALVVGLAVIIGAAVLTLTEGPDQTERLGITIWTDSESFLGGMDAIVSGTLDHDEAAGCFLLRDGSGAHPLAFPADTWLISADPIELLVPGAGIVELGAHLEGGGGYIDPRDEWTVPDACFAESDGSGVAVLQRIGS